MSKLNVFKTPQEFSNATSEYLGIKEIDNNLILGLTNAFENKSKEYPDFNFLSVTNDTGIQAVSLKISPRVIISGDHRNTEAIRIITEYYLKNNISPVNVIGEKKISRKFAETISLKQTSKRELVVHQLAKTNDISLTEGKLEKARLENLSQITELRIEFDTEAFGYLRLKHDELINEIEGRIKREALYNWIVDDKIVSIASIMRNTKNTSVIGLVYTPKKYRGRGYASSTVFSLSNEILNRGFAKCLLFTDKSNPTSNKIYKKIGYEPVTEFEDIYFEKASAG